MSDLTLGLAALPKAQRALWPSLAQVPSGFVLYGGTAMALRLGHRESIDFDFFTSRSFDPATLRSAMPFLADGTVSESASETLSVWVRPSPNERAVRVSFFGGIEFPVLDRPDRPDPDGIVIASLRDLAGTKAKVIHQRIELKDYQDVAALLDAGMSLPEIVAAAAAIFPGLIDYAATVSAITYFEDGDARSFPESLKTRLRAAARGASPVRPPRPSYPSIEVAAAAVGR